MATTPQTSKGTLALVGMRVAGKTWGIAGSNYPALQVQSCTLGETTIDEATRVPGAQGENLHIRGLAGSTQAMTVYVDYLNPMTGYDVLKGFEGDKIPVIHTWESTDTDPTNNVEPVIGTWVRLTNATLGGDKNTGYEVSFDGGISGCAEKITSLPAAPATPGSAGGIGEFTFNFDGDATELKQNNKWNPSNTPYQVVGYRLEYKLTADTEWTIAPAAESDGTTFDILAASSPVPLETDPYKLQTFDLAATLHVLNPGASTITVKFLADAGSYDVRATAVGHFMLESAPVAEAAIVVT